MWDVMLTISSKTRILLAQFKLPYQQHLSLCVCVWEARKTYGDARTAYHSPAALRPPLARCRFLALLVVDDPDVLKERRAGAAALFHFRHGGS